MTTLVVHTGLPMTGAATIRDQLVACREPLERAGVAMVGKDGAMAWDRAVRQVLGGESPQVLKRIVRKKLQDDLSAVLLSSEPAASALTSFTNVMALRAFSRDRALTTRVVLVVREQLELLNALYCQQVMRMETSIGFDAFVTETIASTTLDLGGQFTTLLDDTEIQLVAVRFSQLDEQLPAAGILDAARLPGGEAIAESRTVTGTEEEPAAVEDALPGPVLLTATRLLHKRLTRLGVVRKRSAADVVAAAAVMRVRAATAGWDSEPFWGWSTERAASMAAEFAAGNAVFAARAWGTAWPDAPPSRQQTRQDLAAANPVVVSDAMTMVHRVVDELVTAPPPVLAGSPTGATP